MRQISRWLWTLIALSCSVTCLLLVVSQQGDIKPADVVDNQQSMIPQLLMSTPRPPQPQHHSAHRKITRTRLRQAARTTQPATIASVPEHEPAGNESFNNLTSSKWQLSIRERCWSPGFSPASGKQIDHTPGDFVLSESRLCSGRPLLLVLVHSEFGQRKRRDLIRSTWASLNNINGHRLVVAFVIGATVTDTQQAELQAESEETADLVQVPCSPDGQPRASTCKALYGLRWAHQHCSGAQYLLKVDDFVFVNVFQLVVLVTERMAGLNNTFYCRTAANEDRISLSSYQWYVSEAEWPEAKFPLHCKGLAYLMSGDLPPRLLKCAAWRNHLRLEDIFVTGVLGGALGARRMHWLSGWDSDWLHPRHAGPPVSSSIVLASPDGAPLPSLHRRVWKAALRHSTGFFHL